MLVIISEHQEVSIAHQPVINLDTPCSKVSSYTTFCW